MTCHTTGDNIRELTKAHRITMENAKYQKHRRKRETTTIVANDDDVEDDGATGYTFNYGENFTEPVLNWPTASGITESEAATACNNALDAAPGKQLCADAVSDQDITRLIEDCKLDIQVEYQ